jgi:hypothetical protein
MAERGASRWAAVGRWSQKFWANLGSIAAAQRKKISEASCPTSANCPSRTILLSHSFTSYKPVIGVDAGLIYTSLDWWGYYIYIFVKKNKQNTVGAHGEINSEKCLRSCRACRIWRWPIGTRVASLPVLESLVSPLSVLGVSYARSVARQVRPNGAVDRVKQESVMRSPTTPIAIIAEQWTIWSGYSFFLNYRCVMTAHVTDRFVAFGGCCGTHGCLLGAIPAKRVTGCANFRGKTKEHTLHERRARRDGDLWEVYGTSIKALSVFYLHPLHLKTNKKTDHKIGAKYAL